MDGQKTNTAQTQNTQINNNPSNCTLHANLQHAIYVNTGPVTLNAYNFPANENYVFLINGDLTLNGNLIVPTSSTVTFAVSGNIFVNDTVGSGPQSNTPNLGGIFSTDKSFIIDANAATCSDLRLNIQGTIIVNAAQNGGKLQNNRNLCRFNAIAPTLQITQRFDFIFNLPEFVRSEQTVSEEVSP